MLQLLVPAKLCKLAGSLFHSPLSKQTEEDSWTTVTQMPSFMSIELSVNRHSVVHLLPSTFKPESQGINVHISNEKRLNKWWWRSWGPQRLFPLQSAWIEYVHMSIQILKCDLWFWVLEGPEENEPWIFALALPAKQKPLTWWKSGTD